MPVIRVVMISAGTLGGYFTVVVSIVVIRAMVRQGRHVHRAVVCREAEIQGVMAIPVETGVRLRHRLCRVPPHHRNVRRTATVVKRPKPKVPANLIPLIRFAIWTLPGPALPAATGNVGTGGMITNSRVPVPPPLLPQHPPPLPTLLRHTLLPHFPVQLHPHPPRRHRRRYPPLPLLPCRPHPRRWAVSRTAIVRLCASRLLTVDRQCKAARARSAVLPVINQKVCVSSVAMKASKRWPVPPPPAHCRRGLLSRVPKVPAGPKARRGPVGPAHRRLSLSSPLPPAFPSPLLHIPSLPACRHRVCACV